MFPQWMIAHPKKEMDNSIEKTLRSLGYELNDKGRYWHCAAIYRNGDNKTALQVYKDSGVWRDFVTASGFMPFERLINLSVRGDKHKADQIIAAIKKNSTVELLENEKAPKMEIQQFFDHKEVETLLPHYSFYNKKGISDTTLRMYRCGLSMSGKMNGRFVFPIFDENGKVIGMTGRHLLFREGSGMAKWKHLGRKGDWVYPARLKHDTEDNVFLNSIRDSKEIILVESMGDSLALTEKGIYNHMVLFGVEISSKQMGFLLSQDLSSIKISLNNDKSKASNVGLHASMKLFLKLIEYFDVSRVNITLPLKKDFGEMLENDIDFSEWQKKKIDKVKQVEYIRDRLSLKENKKFSSKKKVLNSYLKSC